MAAARVPTGTIAKGATKRRYLLTDDDLESMNFEMKENPLNKSYPPMKVFKLSEVEAVATEKWGSKECLAEELEKRKKQLVKVESKREDEKRPFWDHENVYGPMQRFLEEDMPLPRIRVTSPYFSNANNNTGQVAEEDLLACDVVICCCDCMHSVPPGAGAKSVFRRFPEARQVDKTTPFNDRRKMGYLSWTAGSADENQVIVILYVVHKWRTASKTRASLPLLNFDALRRALGRLSSLLTSSTKHQSVMAAGFRIGSYTPYGVDPEQFKMAIQESLAFPVQIYNILPRRPQEK